MMIAIRRSGLRAEFFVIYSAFDAETNRSNCVHEYRSVVRGRSRRMCFPRLSLTPKKDRAERMTLFPQISTQTDMT